MTGQISQEETAGSDLPSKAAEHVLKNQNVPKRHKCVLGRWWGSYRSRMDLTSPWPCKIHNVWHLIKIIRHAKTQEIQPMMERRSNPQKQAGNNTDSRISTILRWKRYCDYYKYRGCARDVKWKCVQVRKEVKGINWISTNTSCGVWDDKYSGCIGCGLGCRRKMSEH